MLVAAADVADGDPVVLTVLAFTQLASGKPDEAARTMASARGDGFRQVPRNIAWTFVMAIAMETCVALEQREWCRELYGLLEPALDCTWSPPGGSPAWAPPTATWACSPASAMSRRWRSLISTRLSAPSAGCGPRPCGPRHGNGSLVASMPDLTNGW